ncbi:MAG TPA: hypothetical protein VF221_11790, partial [Chloroflexota bacterium]
LSFVFRLVPRQVGEWFTREMTQPDMTTSFLGPRPLALYAHPDGDIYRVYGKYRVAPQGWERIAPVDADLDPLMSEVSTGNDLLDLAFPPEVLPRALSILENRPALVLPAAARILIRLDRDAAMRVARLVSSWCPGAVRAVYGPASNPILELDELTGAWEQLLTRSFDPDSVLEKWLA